LSVDSNQLGHILAAYAESHVAGSAVLFVGDVTGGVPSRLMALGARSVNAYDRDVARARAFAEQAEPGVVVRPLPHRFEIRDGAFDVAVIADLAATPDPDALTRELSRLVAQDGVVVAATANADAIGDATRAIPYEQFYDLFAVFFAHVRVAAEIPWRGVALAELGERGEDPPVTVDSQLHPEPPTPEHFIVVASHEESDLDPYALYQLPPEEMLLEEIARAHEQPDEEEGERRVSVAAAASARAEVTAAMAAELAEARLRADVLASQLDQQRAQMQKLEQHDAHLEAEQGKNARFAAHLEEERAKNVRFAAELEKAAEDLARAEARLGEIETVTKARLGEMERQIEHGAEEHARELAQAEAQLRERARAVSELEREVSRRERIVRELVVSLEEAQANAQLNVGGSIPPGPVAASPTIEPPPMHGGALDPLLTQRLDAMSLELARYEGELLARDWRIAELERALSLAHSSAGGSSSPARGGGARVTELEAELDTLRRALAQEHEARKHAESGQGADDLKAALAEKMALIEQLSARLSPRERS
jgi:hypothetical protein